MSGRATSQVHYGTYFQCNDLVASESYVSHQTQDVSRISSIVHIVRSKRVISL